MTDAETKETPVTVDGEKQTIRRSNTTFAMIGLKKGTKIFLYNNPKDWTVVMDDKNQISYKGRPKTTISSVSNEKCGRSTNGFWHFFYKDKRLFEMRPDMQK